MALEGFGATSGTTCTIDDEIEVLEGMIDRGEIEHVCTVSLTKPIFLGLRKNLVMSHGTPLKTLREMLKLALKQIDDMIGPE